MSVGITTWIKTCLLKNTPFSRTWTRGAGNGKRSGLSAGRRVDYHFKRWAMSRTTPPAKTEHGKIARRAIAAVEARGIRPLSANTFLKHGPIRTHTDGIGACGSTKVIIELKSTTKSLAAHSRGYHSPCSKQPVVGALANTEYTHHMLQLGWTVMAFRANNPGQVVTGIVVVAAIDGAKVVCLDEKFSRPSWWATMVDAYPTMRSAKGVNAKHMCQFPEAGIPAVERAAGSAAIGIGFNKRVLQLSCGGGAVAINKPLNKITITDKKAMIKSLGTAKPMFFVYPTRAGWISNPLVRQ